MKKVIHLVNSKSFLLWIQKSSAKNSCDNEYVLLDLKKRNVYEKESGNYVISIDTLGKKKILAMINESDIVIHYFLDYTKSELILKSNSNVIHYWYFFGGDVYQQISSFREKIFLDETKKWMRGKFKYRYRIELRNFLYKYVKRVTPPEELLLSSFGRIKNVLWYIQDEIDSISNSLTLPDFCYHKFFEFTDVFPFEKSQLNNTENKILLGNSAAIENNHLDFLLTAKKSGFNGEVALPFSYGDQERYKKHVKKRFTNVLGKRVVFAECLMPLKDYYEWLNSFPTAVMLHKRQQALGNIFYLIANGTKLYMNEDNLIFDWLKKIGVHVFSYGNDFISDSNRHELKLSKKQMDENFNAVRNELSRKSDFVLN